jgi:small subunit ribosomal protein S3|uniref:Small ribosomal subunit protein uS3c n=1 Tax=Thecamonas trahens TaxID=529818 RepID=A0A0B5GWA4_THETB|nr:ribosomal protein S3 [Thecamonas trahens]AJF36632.1 ribosomal protein S3 [Thecamonas trahens]
MGHQNHATGLRTAITKNWSSKWSTSLNNKEQYQFLLEQDLLIKEFIKSFCSTNNLNLGPVFIKRSQNNLFVFIGLQFDNTNKNKNSINKDLFTKELKVKLEQFTESKTHIFISSINNELYNAKLLSNFIADNLTKLRNYSSIFQSILRNLNINKGSIKLQRAIQGIKVHLSGRLNGVDRARTVKFNWGSLPLNTLKTKIEFAKNTAYTKYGTIGIKVWIAFKK